MSAITVHLELSPLEIQVRFVEVSFSAAQAPIFVFCPGSFSRTSLVAVTVLFRFLPLGFVAM